MFWGMEKWAHNIITIIFPISSPSSVARYTFNFRTPTPIYPTPKFTHVTLHLPHNKAKVGLEGNDCDDNDGGRKGCLFVGVHNGNIKASVALKGKGCGDDDNGRKQYDVPVVAGTYLGLDSVWNGCGEKYDGRVVVRCPVTTLISSCLMVAGSECGIRWWFKQM
ncbi:unnamed protein product [Lactuca virosa]|uniref:Uncharacterized protein n=1 Tax=Lactuca virosa TaxID=75947 RepID=A0AAU9N039_9ASTR|nr:unnamed protein product [Lactuca virosa]